MSICCNFLLKYLSGFVLILILWHNTFADDELEKYVWSFAQPGFNKDKTYQDYTQDYNVRLNDGAFILSKQLVSVPGRHGLGLQLNLTYNSKVFQEIYWQNNRWEPCTHGWHKSPDVGFGPGWNFGIARVGFSFTGFQNQFAFQWGDGTVELFYVDFRKEADANSNNKYYITDKFTRCHKYYENNQWKYKIRTVNGTEYLFDWDEGSNSYCTHITDKYDNEIQIDYFSSSSLIEKITDTIGREYNFYRTVDGNNYDKIIYESGETSSPDTIEIRFSYFTNKGIQNDKILESVTYWQNDNKLDYGSHFNYHDLLEMSTYEFPTGGEVAISYERKGLLKESDYANTFDVRCVTSTVLTGNITTTYDYNYNDECPKAYSIKDNEEEDVNPAPIDHYFNTTKVIYPDGNKKVYKFEVNMNSKRSWRRGLLREIEEYAGTDLLRKTYKTYVDVRLRKSGDPVDITGAVSWPAAEVIKVIGKDQTDVKFYYNRKRANTSFILSSNPYSGETDGYNKFGNLQYELNHGEITQFDLTYRLASAWVNEDFNLDSEVTTDNKLTKFTYDEIDDFDYRYSYNSALILSQMESKSIFEIDGVGGETEKYKGEYTYWNNGNIKTMSEEEHGDKSRIFNFYEDIFGNITEVRKSTGGRYEKELYEYGDDYDNAYITRKIQTGGAGVDSIIENYEYNFYTGDAIKYISINSDTTDFKYDELGRLLKIIKTGDSESLPTQEIEYDDYSASQDYNKIKVLGKKQNNDYYNPIYHIYDKLGRLVQSQQLNESVIANTSKEVSAAVGEGGSGSNPDTDEKYLYIDFDQEIEWECSIWEEDAGQVSSTFELYQNDTRRVYKKTNGTYYGFLQVSSGDICKIVARVSASHGKEGSANGEAAYERFEEISLKAFKYDERSNLKFESNQFGVTGNKETVGNPISDVWNISGIQKIEYDYDNFNRVVENIYQDNSISYNIYGSNYTIAVNENGDSTKTIFDAYGNMDTTIQNFGKTNPTPIQTVFNYDVFNNLTKVKSPMGSSYDRTYEYSGFSELLHQNMPASSNNKYFFYDNLERLRLYKDQNQISNVTDSDTSNFYYNKYDIFGRLIEVGEFLYSSYLDDDGTIFNLEPIAENPYFPGESPNDPKDGGQYVNIFQEHYYDGDSAYSGATNLIGRVSCIKYKTQGQWSYTYYSYNDRGWIEWMVNDIIGLEKKIEYEYDLQGNVTKIIYDTDGMDKFYIWYVYNGFGQLSEVYSRYYNTKPTYTDAEYEYWPSGAVKTAKLGQYGASQYAEILSYNYNEREWLVDINAPNGVEQIDPENPSTNFAMKLYYNSGDGTPYYNGNISVADYFTNDTLTSHAATPTGSHFHRYLFEYDKINRLTSADFKYASIGATFSWLNTSNAFDLNNIGYDSHGNINSLTRKNSSGAGSQYNYNYETGTHKLDWVQNYSSQSSNNYDYDENGNLIKDNSKHLNSSNFEYDYRNLPTYIQEQVEYNSLYYAYDFNGNRVYKYYDTDEGSNYDTGKYYIRGIDGKTLAVYDKDKNLLFYNLYGLDLIGKIAREE